MDNVAIHRATLSDLDALVPLLRGYRVFYDRTAQPDAERRFLHDRLTKHDSAIFIASDCAKAAGFVQLYMTHSSLQLAPALLLEDLFVNPGSRGRGIGRALLDRAREHALQIGAAGMFLETAHDNLRAQRVYERAGWQVESVFRKYTCPLTAAPP